MSLPLRIASLLVLVGWGGLVTGCGDSAAPPASSGTGSSGAAVRTANPTTIENYGEVGDPLPALDKGRLIVAPPQSWIIAPRDKKYVVQFVPEASKVYPRIMISADAESGDASVTPADLEAFVERVQNAIAIDQAESDSTAKITVQPRIVGKNAFAEYSRAGKAGSTRVDRVLLVTVQGGRRFTVELRALAGSAIQHKNALYAVAGHVRFPSAASESADESDPDARDEE